MNKSFLLLCLTTAIAFTACNKGRDLSKERIKKMSSNRGYSTEYSYNTDGVLASTRTGEGGVTTYKREGNTILQQYADSVHNYFINTTLYLGSNGLVDSSVTHTPRGTYIKIYKHDADGYITGTEDFNDMGVINYTQSEYKDGNQVKTTVLDTAAQPALVVYYTYDLKKQNFPAYENYGMVFLGHDSKNLVSNIIQVSSKGDTLHNNVFHYYYDDKGRINSRTIYEQDKVLMDSTNYTFNDQK
ncbi:MAG TPA: hypothetical protein VG603_03760 [Chitinophagales bacterium]|nr:hypothetical protein [Chitinophagales bacterium]